MDCTEKITFETRDEAERAILAAEYLHSAKGSLKTYRCTECELYHFSSK